MRRGDVVCGPLSSLHVTRDASFWTGRAAELGLSSLGMLLEKIRTGQVIELAYAGNRADLAECLIGLVPVEARLGVSFTTSLRPSMVRPYQLVLIGATG